jgi:hypothetical protein
LPLKNALFSDLVKPFEGCLSDEVFAITIYKLGLIAPYDQSKVLKELDLALLESNYQEYQKF